QVHLSPIFMHSIMVEEEGFEPPRGLTRLSVFKTDPFSRTWVFLLGNKKYFIRVFNQCQLKLKIKSRSNLHSEIFLYFPIISLFLIYGRSTSGITTDPSSC